MLLSLKSNAFPKMAIFAKQKLRNLTKEILNTFHCVLKSNKCKNASNGGIPNTPSTILPIKNCFVRTFIFYFAFSKNGI